MNNTGLPFLFIALPVINEYEQLPRLIECIAAQSFREFKVLVCINQPDEWWSDPLRKDACENNLKSIEYLKEVTGFDLGIIDKSTPGNGWHGKRHGVGWARKILMDAIDEVAEDRDVILSLDADVTFSPDYFASVARSFALQPDTAGMAVPYFHNPVSDPAAYRAILRYEIYMRYYSLNLWRISSPYTFTALGSAMACPVWAFRAIGGMTPKMSGEDFYFLQKLRKFGKMIFWNQEKVYPAARFSDRVYFGTGPAMTKGNEGDWSSYPIYSHGFFDEILETYRLFPRLLRESGTTRVTEFLSQQLKEKDPFQLLRENTRDVNQFVRSCHEKFDGLRILQYLKFRQTAEPRRDEENLQDYLDNCFGEEVSNKLLGTNFSFLGATLDELEHIRGFLAKEEEIYQVSSVPSLPGQRLPAE